MAFNPDRLGPGQLSFGAAGSTTEFGVSVSDAAVVPSSSDGDRLNVLSGDEFVDAGEETWTLEGVLYQSYDADSLLAWCNEHSGEELDFTFVPVTGKVLRVNGRALIRSVKIGGTVKTRNTSDFTFGATNVVVSTTDTGA